jgi:four helix bundle protein
LKIARRCDQIPQCRSPKFGIQARFVSASRVLIGGHAVYLPRSESVAGCRAPGAGLLRGDRPVSAQERFGESGQIRSAALSIAANIAEGQCRRTRRAYANHVSIALGSHGALCTLLELSARLGFISSEDSSALQPATDAVGKMLYALFRALDQGSPNLQPRTSNP